ncbi:hypothetical protein ANRL1_04382 [Anaerolineae bacterium]|nr:hypothetical protein ANRL1_04382 [Anaerolineae bacterium]
MSDEEIDRIVLIPGKKSLLGTLSQYANRGELYPDEFPELCRYHRFLGCILWGMLILTVLIVLCSITLGVRMYWL